MWSSFGNFLWNVCSFDVRLLAVIGLLVIMEFWIILGTYFRPSMQVVADTAAYYPKDGTSEVSQALLNYVFKYQLPEDTKTRYTFRQTLPAETYNRIQTLPLVPQHQTTKYILPEFKISGLSGIQQPAGTINYLQPLSLGTSYSST